MPITDEKIPFNEARQIFISRLLRKIFLEDWLMKLVALVITLALWLGVSGLRAPKTVRLRAVALNLQISNDVEITNSPVQEIDIVVTGDKRKTDNLNARDLVVSLDLSNVQPGDRMVQLSPENVSVELPTGVRLEEIQPNKIAVNIETVEEREIPVKATTEGGVSESFEIYSETAMPAKVRVRAPSSYIKSLNFVSTEKINLDNHSEDFTVKQIPLNLSNPKATVLDTAVDITFRIGEKRGEKTFLVNVKDDQTKRKATVILFGIQSLLNNVRAEQLQVEMIKNDSGEESLRLNLPAELQDNVEIRKLKVK
jgi:YbbR domain-containing protein